MQLKELQAGQGKVDVIGQIVDIKEPRQFEKFGKQGKVANATLRDESGDMTLTLWNEQVEQIKVGDRIHITNGYVSEWKGERQLSTGKFGKLEVVSNEPVAARPAAPANPAKPTHAASPMHDENAETLDEDEEPADEDW
ncbi:hypothetical protein HY642_01500 [Candidatus Woesearchaeota archaeon]|nr:hypothetical protein [Candidatus Woesearchaeota archaeon]